MTEYTVHFQKGTRVGARSLRMVTVEADNYVAAIAKAKREFSGEQARGYRLIRVDHYDDTGGEVYGGRMVIDY